MEINKLKVKRIMYLWLYHWGQLIDGLLGVISFTCIDTGLSFKLSDRLFKATAKLALLQKEGDNIKQGKQ